MSDNKNHTHSDKVLGAYGPIKFILRTIEHVSLNGTWVKYPWPWAIMDRGDSVAVLIHDRKNDKVVLVQQYRPAIFSVTTEVVAGSLPAGMSPEECAHKEAMEEVKLKLESLTHIRSYLPSPGGSSERIHLFYATVSNTGLNGVINGVIEENEMTRKFVLSANKFLEMVRKGEIEDGKTIMLADWLAAQRDNM